MVKAFLQVAGASYQLDKEKGYLAFVGKNGKPILVYSAPVLQGPKHSVAPEFEWKPLESELHISLERVTYPLCLAFGVSSQVPAEGKMNIGAPSVPLAAESESSGSDSDVSEGNKSRGFSVCNIPGLLFANRFPK